MNIAIYGGSFNPPHLGHLDAAATAAEQLCPDRLLIIPDNENPQKETEPGSPSAEQRLELCKLAFRSIPGAEVSDMELSRGGKSYTAETLEHLREQYPEAEFTLVLGADMLLKLENWYRVSYIIENCTLAVLSREEGGDGETAGMCEHLRSAFGARVKLLEHVPVPMSSEDVRRRLRMRLGADMLDGAVYAEIIRHGWYEALPELSWLREQVIEYLKPSRIAHVAGCEGEAVTLARQWGGDMESAAEAGILHDITKKLNFDEQLILCRKYGIIPDDVELANPQLLHALTGAALARDRFGISNEIYDAIRWHTTGKPDMTLLEKIIYLADVIEPTRNFDGVDRLRELCYEDIDAAMELALELSLEHVRAGNIEPHKNSVKAFLWYKTKEEI